MIAALAFVAFAGLAPGRAAGLDPSQMSADEIKALEQRLTDAGCYKGAIDGTASGALDDAIKVCPDQRPFLRIETGMHTLPIRRIGVDVACRMPATASHDKTVRLWSLPDGKLERTVRLPIGEGDAGKVYATALSPDGRWLAAGGWDAARDKGGPTSLTLVDLSNGAIRRYGEFKSAINHIAFSPDGRRVAPAAFIPPQLSQSVEKPPSGQWLHEIKLDGFRMAARIDHRRAQLLTRTGLDWTDKYPSGTAALTNLNVKTAYIDGELCGVDDVGLPSFAQTQAATDGEREVQLVYYVLDLLHLDGRDLSRLPLIERKAVLAPLIADKPGLQFNGHETGDGELVLEHAGKLDFEGVVSKTIDAPMRQETAASGAKPNGLTARSSSSSAGPTRRERAPISGRCCWATSLTTASSSTLGAWARGCPSKCSPISDAAWIR
jgi:hypothetical protein